MKFVVVTMRALWPLTSGTRMAACAQPVSTMTTTSSSPERKNLRTRRRWNTNHTIRS